MQMEWIFQIDNPARPNDDSDARSMIDKSQRQGSRAVFFVVIKNVQKDKKKRTPHHATGSPIKIDHGLWATVSQLIA